jgi:hypothetical protein
MGVVLYGVIYVTLDSELKMGVGVLETSKKRKKTTKSF